MKLPSQHFVCHETSDHLVIMDIPAMTNAVVDAWLHTANAYSSVMDATKTHMRTLYRFGDAVTEMTPYSIHCMTHLHLPTRRTSSVALVTTNLTFAFRLGMVLGTLHFIERFNCHMFDTEAEAFNWLDARTITLRQAGIQPYRGGCPLCILQ